MATRRPWRRGLGGAALVPRPWATRRWCRGLGRRALAEASRSGWRGNRACGMRQACRHAAAEARRWHGPEREASASACGGMGHGACGMQAAAVWRRGGMATRRWCRGLGRRALAEASRSGWRGNRAGGMRQACRHAAAEARRWHGPEREASASACVGMGACGMQAAVWRRGVGAAALGDARSLKLRGPGGAGIGQACGGGMGGGMVRSAKLQRAHAVAWGMGHGPEREASASACVGMGAVAWSGARSFSERMRWHGARHAASGMRHAGGGGMATRRWWRGNRAGVQACGGGGPAVAWSGARSFSERMRWHGGGGMVRSAKLQRAHAVAWGMGHAACRRRRYGGAALVARRWCRGLGRRALAEASRSGWRGNRAGVQACGGGGPAVAWSGARSFSERMRWHGGGGIGHAASGMRHAGGGGMATRRWCRGLGDARFGDVRLGAAALGDARSLKLRGP
jgi:hypothetical protein